ncbi:MAG: iron ABC transporter permease [Trueperaceae bacterium]
MRRTWLGHASGVLATGFLTAFLFVPLAWILWRSLGPGAAEGIGAALARTLANPYYRERLAFTLGQALLSTLLTVALGLPSALLFSRYVFRGKRALTAAFTVPFVMPTVVAGIGFLALVGPRGITGIDLRDTLAVVLLAHVFFNYAVVARLVGSFLEGVAPRLEQAAATLGAGPWRSLVRVTLPLAVPATLASAVLVFLFCFTSFGVILILAPSARFATLEVEIYRLTARLLELDTAAVLVLAQLLVVGGASWVYTRLQSRVAVALAAGGGTRRRPSAGGRALLGVNLALAAALILAPLLALSLQALTAPTGAFPSLANLRAMLDAPPSIGYASLGRALTNSLTFALLSAGLALVVGLGFAYAVARGGWRALDTASLLPLATSPVTLGFGYLLAYPALATTFWGIPLAHALVAFPFVARTLLPALRAQPRSQLDAAALLGAGPVRTFVRVELPVLAPSLLTAAAFAFAISMGEFGASLLLVRPEYATLPVAIYDRLGRPGPLNFGAALGLSLVLMTVTALVMLVLQRRGRTEF